MLPSILLAQAGPGAVVSVLIGMLILLIMVVFALSYGLLWLKALLAGTHVGVFEIIGMRLRGVPPALIVNMRVMAKAAGVPVETAMLEAQHMAGGNVTEVVIAMVAAKKAELDWSFPEACSWDLAGYDPLEVVRLSLERGYTVKPGDPDACAALNARRAQP